MACFVCNRRGHLKKSGNAWGDSLVGDSVAMQTWGSELRLPRCLWKVRHGCTCACNTNIVGVEAWGLLLLAELQVQWDTLSEGNKIENDRAGHQSPPLASVPHTVGALWKCVGGMNEWVRVWVNAWMNKQSCQSMTWPIMNYKKPFFPHCLRHRMLNC